MESFRLEVRNGTAKPVNKIHRPHEPAVKHQRKVPSFVFNAFGRRSEPAAPVDVDTRGEYASFKEFHMNTTTQTIGTTTLNIDGMSCGHCVQAVTKALSAVAGIKVKSVEVGSAVIETPDGGTTSKAVAALGEAGYPAKAVGDAAAAAHSMPAKSGGGCCGGAKAMTADGAPGAKTSGGCCG